MVKQFTRLYVKEIWDEIFLPKEIALEQWANIDKESL